MLNKIIAFLFFIYSCLSIDFIKADELINISKQLVEKYNFSICAIFKNEAPCLKEWIEYHRLFGVDHFYLYNIGSNDSFQDILRPYVEEGIVTLTNWPEVFTYQDDNSAYKWALCTQIPAYENAVNFKARN